MLYMVDMTLDYDLPYVLSELGMNVELFALATAPFPLVQMEVRNTMRPSRVVVWSGSARPAHLLHRPPMTAIPH